MKTRGYIILLAVALLATACERTLDFKGPENEEATDLVINAAAVAGTPLTLYLSRAYQIGKNPSVQYYDYQHAVLMKDDIATDYQVDDYYQKTAVKDARVTVTVNGSETYGMTLEPESCRYESDYVPQAGDRLVVTATTTDGREVRAETTVPAEPKIEVVNYEVLPENPYQDLDGLVNQSDTIMRLNLRISDTGGEHYYRLRVRSERKGTVLLGKMQFYIMQDIFFSSDELFLDNRLTSNIGGWRPYFSNVFDNSLMGGGSYAFTVDIPKASPGGNYIKGTMTSDEEIPYIPPRVMVELQAISYDLYQYLKSVQLYRTAEDDKNAEPILIHSNAEGGWGILGALSYDRHYVEFGD